jgi:excisionase family DNA binding protein
VSVPEAAERLGIGVTKLKELIGCGRIPSVVIGRRRLIPMAGLDAPSWCAGDRLTMPFGVGEESRVHPAAASNRGWSWGVAKSVDPRFCGRKRPLKAGI